MAHSKGPGAKGCSQSHSITLCNGMQPGAALGTPLLLCGIIPAPCCQGKVTTGPSGVLLSHWSALQWAPPTSTNSQGVTLSGLIQPTPVRQSGGCQVENQVRDGFLAVSPGSSSSPGLRPVGKLGSPANRLGVLSCRTPEPLSWPPAGLGPGCEAAVSLSPKRISVPG